jgi:hypothetical protein
MLTGELRFRIKETQEKIGWDWSFANRIHGAVFYDIAYYDEPDAEGETLWKLGYSLGARVSLDTTVGFTFPITWDFIVAAPSLGKPKAYVGVMTSF